MRDTVDFLLHDWLNVTTLCQRHGLGMDFGADLIARGVTIDAARAAILDRLVEQNPTTRGGEIVPAQARGTSTSDLGFRDAITEALLHRHAPGLHPLGQHGREFRGMTLLEIARAALERRGVSTRGMAKMELAGEALLGRASVGYHSSSDFPLILANVANKTLRAAYDGTPRSFTAWARQVTIADFKPVSRTQLGGAPDLLKVPESGEFTYGTIGEGREVYALATYGRIIGITRQTLINDDLDAFTRVPTAFGAAAADLESDLIWAIFTGNPTMADTVALFHSTHANLGTSGAISATTLAEMRKLGRKQTGLDGESVLNIQYKYLIVPAALETVAQQYLAAIIPNAATSVNPFQGAYQLIIEPRLDAASSSNWFAAAEPSQIDTIEIAYLDGQSGVRIESELDFDTEGMKMKVAHDVGVKAIDHRGLFKNAH